MSPRAFDSDDVARSAGPFTLRFEQIVDCPACGCATEGVFHDRTASMSVEDMTDAPIGEHRCPECDHRWVSAYDGWTFFSEAG